MSDFCPQPRLDERDTDDERPAHELELERLDAELAARDQLIDEQRVEIDALRAQLAKAGIAA